MDRNDQIFFSSVGGAAVVAVLAAVIAIYGTSQTAPEWTQGILTVLAISVAVLVPRWSDNRRLETRQRAAEIVVASALRSWLRVAAEEIMDNQQHRGTGGHDGVEKFDMPTFTISFEHVAEMREQYAREVSSLLERRERRQNLIYSERYYGDDTDGIMEYFEQIAHIFWSARRIYREIARDRGLDEFTNRPPEIDAVNNATEQAKKYRALPKQNI